MGFLDELKGWFRRESADAKAWADDAVRDGNAALDRAERDLAATPEERLQASIEGLQANDDAFAALRAKADAASARPLAQRELADAAERELVEDGLAEDHILADEAPEPPPGHTGT